MHTEAAGVLNIPPNPAMCWYSPEVSREGKGKQHTTEPEVAAQTSPKQVQGTEFNGVIKKNVKGSGEVLGPLHC